MHGCCKIEARSCIRVKSPVDYLYLISSILHVQFKIVQCFTSRPDNNYWNAHIFNVLLYFSKISKIISHQSTISFFLFYFCCNKKHAEVVERSVSMRSVRWRKPEYVTLVGWDLRRRILFLNLQTFADFLVFNMKIELENILKKIVFYFLILKK